MGHFPFCNTSLSLELRVVDLVSHLSLDEKIMALGSEVGPLKSIGLNAYNWWSEGAHGISHVRNDNSTPFESNFALPITLAQSFNRSLWYETGLQIGIEARAFMNQGNAYSTFWAPVINIIRDPRWGRNVESPGEDPFHVGEYAVEFVQGMERNPGDPEHIQASACCKHFVANDMDGWNGTDRNHYDAVVSLKDLHDSYLPPFKACVEKGGVSGMMCSYNSLNGIPACANEGLLKILLRETWGFDGYVTSDCDADSDVYFTHHFTKTPEEAVAAVLRAGTDIDCGKFVRKYVESALNKGLVKNEDIDAVLHRSFLVRMRLGHFDPPGFLQTIGMDKVCSKEAIELARDGARQGCVLLKNHENVLPLSKHQKIVVIGPTQNISYEYAHYYGGNTCDNKYYSLVDAIASHSSMVVESSPGLPTVISSDTSFIASAVDKAYGADVVVLALGQNLLIEREGKDRVEITFTLGQLHLLEAIASTDQKIVVVVFAGGAIDVTPLLKDRRIDAVLFVGQPSTAILGIGDVLYGHSPAGRMTQTTYPGDFVHSVSLFDQGMRPGSSVFPPLYKNPGRTYRFFTGNPVLPFGFGLSYTTFEYKFRNQMLTVTNTGAMDSQHVVLAFIAGPRAGLQGVPLRTLFSFDRIFLAKGESIDIQFEFGEHCFEIDEQGRKIQVFGKHQVQFGVENPSLEIEYLHKTIYQTKK